jgi:hypothetical protein
MGDGMYGGYGDENDPYAYGAGAGAGAGTGRDYSPYGPAYTDEEYDRIFNRPGR